LAPQLAQGAGKIGKDHKENAWGNMGAGKIGVGGGRDLKRGRKVRTSYSGGDRVDMRRGGHFARLTEPR